MEFKVGDWVEGAGVDCPMRIVEIVQAYRTDPAPRAQCEWGAGASVRSRTFKLSTLTKAKAKAKA